LNGGVLLNLCFHRELPEPVVTSELLARFEDAASIKELATREQELAALVSALPPANRTALAWIILHLETVAAHVRGPFLTPFAVLPRQKRNESSGRPSGILH